MIVICAVANVALFLILFAIFLTASFLLDHL